MGVEGLFINDASWDGSSNWANMLLRFNFSSRKVNRMYNIHQQAMSQWDGSVPVSC